MRKTLSGGIAALALVGAGLTAIAPGASAYELRGAADTDCTPGGASGAKVADGTSLTSDPNTLTERQVAAREADLSRQLAKLGYDKSADPKLANGSQKIPTVVHVIRKTNGSGNIGNKKVQRQINVLNDGFAGRTAGVAVNTPFRFKLKNVTRTNKTKWYNWDIQDDDSDAKNALHSGGFQRLNIYIAKLEGGLLGYATFPTGNKRRLALDGLVLTRESLPGNGGPYGRGDTGTHEVGHWLNLYHTFQGGCSDPGDYIADTPRQRAGNNVFKCDRTLNTCGNNDGSNALRDPVHNFMNYTDDPCLDRYTLGQEERMELSYLAYRKN